MEEFPFEKGDSILVRTLASTGEQVIVGVAVEFEDGSPDLLQIDANPAGTRQVELFESDKPFNKKGRVVGLSADVKGSAVKRGEYFMSVFIRRGGDDNVYAICSCYVASDFFGGLGFFEPPVSGHGFVNWVQESDDIAGNAVATINLAATNTRRRALGVVVKYHQVGGGDATITITLRDMATGVGPTNWSIDSDTWISPSLVLGANQEGLIHVGEHGFVALNDAGVLSYADNSTAPNPFPFLVLSGDTVDLIIAASGGASGDDFDVWVQYEEWMEQ